jgi:hypothetical protein
MPAEFGNPHRIIGGRRQPEGRKEESTGKKIIEIVCEHVKIRWVEMT